MTLQTKNQGRPSAPFPKYSRTPSTTKWRMGTPRRTNKSARDNNLTSHHIAMTPLLDTWWSWLSRNGSSSSSSSSSSISSSSPSLKPLSISCRRSLRLMSSRFVFCHRMSAAEACTLKPYTRGIYRSAVFGGIRAG